MDNVGRIVVEDLDEVISFFTELGPKLEGRATVEGMCRACHRTGDQHSKCRTRHPSKEK